MLAREKGETTGVGLRLGFVLYSEEMSTGKPTVTSRASLMRIAHGGWVDYLNNLLYTYTLSAEAATSAVSRRLKSLLHSPIVLKHFHNGCKRAITKVKVCLYGRDGRRNDKMKK